MSTKINVRSPFYLNLTEPVEPQPLFTCSVANVQGLAIDQQGQITLPSLAFGSIDQITSTDSDFSNNKFATVTTATARTLTVRIFIPAGFSNVADGFIDCNEVVTQPALITSQPTPSDPPVSCSDGPTTNGSISAKTLDANGDSETVDLSSFFTQGTLAIAGYNIYNPDNQIVNASVSGNTLTLRSNTIGGSTTVHVSAFDNGTNTCTATQSISVTVNGPAETFTCTTANLVGGSIAQDGTITNPTTFANITAIKSTSGGSSITSHSANNTGSDRSVTLFFDLTVPSGYSNAAATVECSATFTQPAGDPEFTCDIAGLSGQQISSKGSILKGSINNGTIQSFSPIGFDPVSSDTARTVTFTITIPSGYSNSGTITCQKTITQPAEIQTCGSSTYYISAGKLAPKDFCNNIYTASRVVKATTSSQTLSALGARVCLNGAPYEGKDRYYAVFTKQIDVGKGSGPFHLWQIDDNGIIQDVQLWNCGAGTDGNGKGGPQ